MGEELAGRKNARAGALVTSRVGVRSGVGVWDGGWVDGAGQVGETRKYSPVGAEVSRAAIWQVARPSIKITARPNIHFEKLGPPLIRVDLRLIAAQSQQLDHPRLIQSWIIAQMTNQVNGRKYFQSPRINNGHLLQGFAGIT